MALSTCIKCGSTLFEATEYEPDGSKYKVLFVQCMMCGGVVGVRDYYNTGALLKNQNIALKRIAAALNVHVDLEGA